MVASSCLGVSSKWTILLLEEVFELRTSLSCDGDNEKNAVSEADAAAEQNNNARIVISPARIPAEEARLLVLNVKTIKALNASGSGSATVWSNCFKAAKIIKA